MKTRHIVMGGHYTYRLKAAEYAARIAYEDELALTLVSWRSLRMAAVRRAVDSTRWGQPPRCIHMETLETACCCPASSASVATTTGGIVAAVGVIAAVAPTTDEERSGGGSDAGGEG